MLVVVSAESRDNLLPTTAESSIRIYEHKRVNAQTMASRQSSLNIHPPTSKQPTMVSVKSVSSNMSSIQEDQQPEQSTLWSSDPMPRCSSPDLVCDGFKCDSYSVEAARVVSYLLSVMFLLIFLTMCLVARSGSVQGWSNCLGRPTWTFHDCGKSASWFDYHGFY